MKILAARFVGWLANFFPDHYFYSDTFASKFDLTLASESGELSDAHAGWMSLAMAMGKTLDVGGTMEAEFINCTHGGKEYGSYRLTVEKISDHREERD